MQDPNAYSFLEANFLYMVIGGVAIVTVFFGCITWADRTKQRERSRREIAAYIAEGSMTPEDGERLMNAGTRHVTPPPASRRPAPASPSPGQSTGQPTGQSASQA